MSQRQPKQITLSRNSLIGILLLAVLVGGAVAYLSFGIAPEQTINKIAVEPSQQAPVAEKVEPPSQAPVVEKIVSKPVPKKKIVKKVRTAQPKSIKRNNEFVLEGFLSTAGEPWVANMILVKVLWLKNKNQKQFLLGKETAVVQATPNGFAYRIILKAQGSDFLNWNGGVEGNVGRIVAFLDHKRDGRLSVKQDKIIAVSKELLRYRTGRFDRKVLNEIQQQNIKQAGKGYVIVRNMQLDDRKADWKVVASQSPARLDLSAAETSLPGMYNTFLKLQ